MLSHHPVQKRPNLAHIHKEKCCVREVPLSVSRPGSAGALLCTEKGGGCAIGQGCLAIGLGYTSFLSGRNPRRRFLGKPRSSQCRESLCGPERIILLREMPMTASEANRQRVLTLLAVEWKQSCEETKTAEERVPSKCRVRTPKVTDSSAHPHSSEQSATLHTSEYGNLPNGPEDRSNDRANLSNVISFRLDEKNRLEKIVANDDESAADKSLARAQNLNGVTLAIRQN